MRSRIWSHKATSSLVFIELLKEPGCYVSKGGPTLIRQTQRYGVVVLKLRACPSVAVFASWRGLLWESDLNETDLISGALCFGLNVVVVMDGSRKS